jgi:hypothetical protein
MLDGRRTPRAIDTRRRRATPEGGGRGCLSASPGARWALLGILAVGIAVRFWGLTFGLPLVRSRPDELLIISFVLPFFEGSLNPEFFDYPALHLYLLGALYGAYYLWGLLAGQFTDAAAFAASLREHWEPFFVIGRATAATMGSATVLVVYALGARLFGVQTGLLAALFAALSFLHARDSHFGTTDVPMTFFLMCAMLLLVRASQSRAPWDYRLAGILAGCATATKYPAVMIAMPMAAVAVTHAWPHRASWRRAWRESRVLAMFVPFVVVFLAANPYLLLDHGKALSDLSALHESSVTGMTPPELLGRGWTYHVPYSLWYGVGVPLLLASVAGLAGMVRRAPAQAMLLAAFPVSYYLVAGAAHNVFVRYMIPVVPFLCVFAAWFVWECSGRIARGSVRIRPALAVVLGLLVVAPSAARLAHFNQLLTQEDSRLIGGRWLAEHVEPGSSIHMSGELYGHPFIPPPSGDDFRYVALDPPDVAVTGPLDSDPDLPDWIVVQRSSLPYSDVAPGVEELLPDEYDLVHVVRAGDFDDPRLVYDLQDGFYVPLAGFRGVRRPGPNLEIYQRRMSTPDGSTAEPDLPEIRHQATPLLR